MQLSVAPGLLFPQFQHQLHHQQTGHYQHLITWDCLHCPMIMWPILLWVLPSGDVQDSLWIVLYVNRLSPITRSFCSQRPTSLLSSVRSSVPCWSKTFSLFFLLLLTLLLKSPIKSKMMLSRWPSYWSLPSEAWWCCPDDPLIEVSHQKHDVVQMTLLLKSPIRSMMVLSRWPSYWSLPSEARWCCPDDPLIEVSHQKHDGVVQMTL